MKRFMLFFTLLIFGTGLLVAQVVEPPTDWLDLYQNYGAFFGTYLGIAGVASFLGEYVIRLLKFSVRWQKVTVVVVLSIGLSFLAMGINIGYLAEAVWYEAALWGALSAAAAAGLRSSNLLFFKTVVDFIIGYLKSKEPTS